MRAASLAVEFDAEPVLALDETVAEEQEFAGHDLAFEKAGDFAELIKGVVAPKGEAVGHRAGADDRDLDLPAPTVPDVVDELYARDIGFGEELAVDIRLGIALQAQEVSATIRLWSSLNVARSQARDRFGARACLRGSRPRGGQKPAVRLAERGNVPEVFASRVHIPRISRGAPRGLRRSGGLSSS